jgi:hypothetical protein
VKDEAAKGRDQDLNEMGKHETYHGSAHERPFPLRQMPMLRRCHAVSVYPAHQLKA